MRALVLHAAGDARIEDRPDPAPPGPGDVTLRVVRAGLCGTDATEYAAGPVMTPLTHPPPGQWRPRVRSCSVTSSSASSRTPGRRSERRGRRPGGRGRGRVVRPVRLVPARPDQPLRLLLDVRPVGRRRPDRAHHRPGGDAPPGRPARLRRQRRAGPAPGGRSARRRPQPHPRRGRRRRARRRGDRLVHRRRRPGGRRRRGRGGRRRPGAPRRRDPARRRPTPSTPARPTRWKPCGS